MINRITRHQCFMDICDTLAKRSTCCRQNVGAVLTYKHRIVSTGWNGPPSGDPHCLGKECQLTSTGGCSRSVHAEINALNFCPRHLKDLTLYVNLSPCDNCARELLISDKISRVFYRQEYRLRDGIQLLLDNYVQVFRITPAGHILDANTNQLIDE